MTQGVARVPKAAKRQAGHVKRAPVRQVQRRSLRARQRRRSFGLPAVRAPAHNLIGQQGLKISFPYRPPRPSASVQQGLFAAYALCADSSLAARQINAIH